MVVGTSGQDRVSSGRRAHLGWTLDWDQLESDHKLWTVHHAGGPPILADVPELFS